MRVYHFTVVSIFIKGECQILARMIKSRFYPDLKTENEVLIKLPDFPDLSKPFIIYQILYLCRHSVKLIIEYLLEYQEDIDREGDRKQDRKKAAVKGGIFKIPLVEETMVVFTKGNQFEEPYDKVVFFPILIRIFHNIIRINNIC